MITRYFQSPDYWEGADEMPAIFLAGGIVDVENWQFDAINMLIDREPGPTVPDKLAILNPRRARFPLDDPNAKQEQIWWEQHHLHLPRVVTMLWFPKSTTVQPGAVFEFGQALGARHPLVIGCDPKYVRTEDVRLMMKFHRPGQFVWSCLEDVASGAMRRASEL